MMYLLASDLVLRCFLTEHMPTWEPRQRIGPSCHAASQVSLAEGEAAN